MKMNKESIMALAAIFAILISAQFAFAQESVSTGGVPYGDDGLVEKTSVSTETAGIADLEDSASGLQVAINQIQTLLTLNQEKKVELELKLANLRLVQAKVAAKNGNTIAMQKALDAHERIIEKVQARIDKFNGANEPEKVKASYGKLARLQKAVEVHEAKIETLKDLIADENLTEEQRSAIQEKLDKVEANTAKLNEMQSAKEEQVKTKLRAVTDMTEDEINSEVKKLEGENGLTEARRLVAENKIKTTQEAIEKIREKLQAEKQNGLDVSAIESQLAAVEQTLSEAKALYTSGKFEESIAALKPVSNYGRNIKIIVSQMKGAREVQNTEKIRALVQEAQSEGTTVREKIRERAEDERTGFATGKEDERTGFATGKEDESEDNKTED